jgi:Ca2+-binding EF-hand superfamily protein
MSRRFFSLFTGLLLATAATAQASDDARLQRIQEELQQRFTQADTNHDGLLSREEARDGMPRVYKRYDDIDSQQSGALSLEDITRYLLQQRDKH